MIALGTAYGGLQLHFLVLMKKPLSLGQQTQYDAVNSIISDFVRGIAFLNVIEIMRRRTRYGMRTRNRKFAPRCTICMYMFQPLSCWLNFMPLRPSFAFLCLCRRAETVRRAGKRADQLIPGGSYEPPAAARR